MLTNADIVELTEFRHRLHRHPEVSGQEEWTAAQVAQALEPLCPGRILTGLGGHGVAAVWSAPIAGPTVMFRCELDALPIEDLSQSTHRSTHAGKGHLCGHDGHMSILMGLARLISRHPPAKGRVVLLFQPAEEDGSGAAAVLADPGFAEIRPDWAFAVHNMPGMPLGHAVIAAGPANCASEGLRVVFGGRTAHASMPETGLSPALALAALMPAALAAGPGGAVVPGFRLVSICHARMGEPAFGITPGEGELWLTLRTLLDDDMAALRGEVITLAQDLAAQHGLTVAFTHHDRFAACTNQAEASAAIIRGLEALGIGHDTHGLPMRASEDFGLFGTVARSAMFLLGAGENRPALHNPDYDFPDDLIAQGVEIFDRIRQDMLG
ncbi:amidohydrolase [Rhodobacter sp. KR11]|uniref:amidohydrolase n=1 Tax=Rhodobacter sp. KR11 TaxID=2974588 RepID=UPI00222343FD|nr:amidohydrolase [Rhodobacter sp. KR11]MCW1918052.1 amidohydrolase [Rhodobacter sp. KR11]